MTLVILFLVLVLGTTLVIVNRYHSNPKRLSLQELKDSLSLAQPTLDKSYSLSGLIEVYEHEQMIEGLIKKDSLNQKDIEALKAFDKKLNNLMNEEN